MKYHTPQLIALMPAINAVQADHVKAFPNYPEGIDLPYEDTQAAYQDYE
jgi:hypothetical protein